MRLRSRSRKGSGTTVASTAPRSPSTEYSTERLSPRLRVRRVHRAEPDHLLDRRAPRDRGRPPDPPVALVDGHRRALDERGDQRREAVFRVHRLDARPLEFEAHESAGRTAGGALGKERPAPGEHGRLVQLDEPAEADLERRVVLLGGDRVHGARVLGLDQDQAGLDPGDVHRADPHRVDAVGPAGGEDGVPDGQGPLRGDPELVAAIARVAGPRDAHVDAGDLRPPMPEVPDPGPVLAGRRLEHLPAELALERERAERLADVLDLDVQARGVQQEPAVAGIGRGHAVLVVGEPRHGAVVQDLAVLVAPGRVQHLIDLQGGDVAGHDPVEEPAGVGPWTRYL